MGCPIRPHCAFFVCRQKRGGYLDSSSQQPSRAIPKRGLWINASIGGSSIDAVSYGRGVSYLHDGKHLISVRFVHSKPIGLGFGGGDEPDERAREIGVLYGRASQNTIGLASFSVGLGRVTGVRRGKLLRRVDEGCWWGFGFGGCDDSYNIYEERTFDTIAIPVEAQLLWMPTFRIRAPLGIGLHGFANLNPELSYWGMSLCLSLGKAW